MKKTTLSLAVMACLTAGAPPVVHAQDYTKRVDTSLITLQSADSIDVTSDLVTEALYVHSGYNFDVGDNGALTVKFNTAVPGARGINITDTTGNNLGTDSTIDVNSQATSGSAAIGINLVSNSSIKSNALDINVSSRLSAIGIDLSGTGNTADLGEAGDITVSSGNVVSGIFINDGNQLTASNLTITADANVANGIAIEGQDVNVNLGRNSVITAKGNAGNGLSISGGTGGATAFTADALTVKGSGDSVHGVLVGTVSADSIISLGKNAFVSTDGTSGTGIVLSETTLGTLTADNITVETQGSMANSVETRNGQIMLTGGSLDSTNAGGVLAENNAQNPSQNPHVLLDGTQVRAGTFGVTAKGANALIDMKDVAITVSNGPAVQVENGAQIQGETLSVRAATGLQSDTNGTVALSGHNLITATNGPALSASGNSRVSLSGSAAIQGDILATDGGAVTLGLNNHSVITGRTDSGNSGNIAMRLSDDTLWSAPGNSTLNSLSLDSSTLEISGGNAGNIVTVLGDYSGNNGVLKIDSVLAGDGSLTDKLVIGGNATGSTDVQVTNLGGQGDDTVNGIEIVSVGGTSEKAAFTNSRAIRAGLYNYSVVQKGRNFYLTSDKTEKPVEPAETPNEPAVPPEKAETPVEPPVVTPTQPEIPAENPGVTPVQPVTPIAQEPGKDISTSAGGYIANLAAANQMFVTRLADREGSTEYINPVTGQRDVTSLWLRQEGGHNRSRADSLRTTSNRYVAQLGGELVNGSFTDTDRWDIGLMAGYANQKGNTTSQRSRYNNDTKSQVHGYSTGLYGTWYQDAKERTGLYVDSWVQYSWFRNSVNEQGQPSDSYSSKGFSASLESGYSWKVVDGERTDFFIQPQAQLVWSGVKADDHRTRTGIHVEGKGENNLQSRLGVKAYLKGHNKIDDNTGRSFKPFVEASWIHNTERYGVRMNGDSLSQDGAKDLAEVKTGVEGQLSSSVSVWGGIGVQVGDKGYSDTQGQVGFKYRF